MTNTNTCRRCTECEGLEHHWIENSWDGDPDDLQAEHQFVWRLYT